MASNLTPQQFSEKWKTRVGQSGQAFKDGVNSVQTAPGQAAAAQKDVYLNNVQASADKWAQNVASVSLQSWKQSTLDFGATAYTSSASKGVSKVNSFAQQFLPHVSNAKQSLPPRGNDAQNQLRYQAMQQALKSFSYNKRSL